MNIQIHKTNELEVAETISDNLIIQDVEDALNLIGNLYYQGFEMVIIHQKNIIETFFDLKNKMVGEILQKFSNYRMRLVIIGDFSNFASQSLNDFIYESNKGKQVNFAVSVSDAIDLLSR